MYTPPLHPPTLKFVSTVGGFQNRETQWRVMTGQLSIFCMCACFAWVYIYKAQALTWSAFGYFESHLLRHYQGNQLPREFPSMVEESCIFDCMYVCIYIPASVFCYVWVYVCSCFMYSSLLQYYSLVPCISVYCMCKLESRPYTTQCMSERK